ncbi:MAG TPA: hypothetical protein VKG79_10025 [Bryobacteraceae bacterium]|nr:hypothetical protein [Bryobacteraceae bacterium]
MGGRRKPEDKGLSEAALIAATGISRRKLVRLRQQGLILAIKPRHGLGRGRGTTALEYPLTAIATINRHNELSQTIKDVGERRWRLWLENNLVRIAPDLADTLGRLRAITSEIKTLSDIETKIPANLWKPTNLPRGHPLRTIFRGLSDDDLHSLTTLLICVVLGIRLPMFDEPNPSPFQIFKRAIGLPKEWQMPPGLFDVFPYMHERIKNGLSTATADELEGARAACRFLSRLLDNPENWRRGAIVVGGAPLPWRLIKLASLLWRSPVVRAAIAGLVILGMRTFKSALGEAAPAAVASMLSKMSISWPESAR